MSHDQIIWQGITAVVTILTVVATWLTTRRAAQAAHAETTAKIDTVQETVNGQTAALHGRVEDLTAALTKHDVDVPPAPAVPGSQP